MLEALNLLLELFYFFGTVFLNVLALSVTESILNIKVNSLWFSWFQSNIVRKANKINIWFKAKFNTSESEEETFNLFYLFILLVHVRLYHTVFFLKSYRCGKAAQADFE